MYHDIFVFVYVALFGLKLALLVKVDVYQLGQRKSDIAIICGPAMGLCVEWIATATERSSVHRLDLVLQFLFVVKVVLTLSRSDSGRILSDFLKARWAIGPSVYC